MKRTLQWKFIRTAMMAVTVLLLVLLGAINLLNWWQVERQTDWMLQVLTQGDAPPVEPKRPEGFLPPLDADDKGAARFFQVFYDGTGQVAYVDVNQIATVTKEEAVDYAAQCQGRDQGTIDRFEFRRVSVPDGQGERILFLDISSSRWSILTVLAISAGMGCCAGWEPCCWWLSCLTGPLLPWPGQWKNSASLSPMPALTLKPPWPLSKPTRMRWSFIRGRPSGAKISGYKRFA